MDYSFFALGLIGAFIGYIVGDFQRQSRYRREARANLALANQRANDRANQRALRARNAVSESVTNGDDDGAAFVLDRVRDGEARRRAVSRPDSRNRVGRYVARGDTRFPDAPPVVLTRTAVGHDSF